MTEPTHYILNSLRTRAFPARLVTENDGERTVFNLAKSEVQTFDADGAPVGYDPFNVNGLQTPLLVTPDHPLVERLLAESEAARLSKEVHSAMRQFNENVTEENLAALHEAVEIFGRASLKIFSL